MQIYATSVDPYESASALDDKSLNLAIIDASLLISQAFRFFGVNRPPYNKLLYRTRKPSHPISKWVRESKGNFEWTLHYLYGLQKEALLRGLRPNKAFTDKFPVYQEILKRKIGFIEKIKKDATPFVNYAVFFSKKIDFRNKKTISEEPLIIPTILAYRKLLNSLWKIKKNVKWTNTSPPNWKE